MMALISVVVHRAKYFTALVQLLTINIFVFYREDCEKQQEA